MLKLEVLLQLRNCWVSSTEYSGDTGENSGNEEN